MDAVLFRPSFYGLRYSVLIKLITFVFQHPSISFFCLLLHTHLKNGFFFFLSYLYS